MVGEFIYGWRNNYAGANVSNLDVTIRTLQRFAPQAKVIVFMHPSEEPHIGKLLELFPFHAVLTYPLGCARSGGQPGCVSQHIRLAFWQMAPMQAAQSRNH